MRFLKYLSATIPLAHYIIGERHVTAIIHVHAYCLMFGLQSAVAVIESCRNVTCNVYVVLWHGVCTSLIETV